MPKWAQILLLAIALGMIAFVPTRRLMVRGPESQHVRGYEFVLLKEGKLEWDRLGFQFAGLGVVAAIVFVATRKN